jgi:gluconolactonase
MGQRMAVQAHSPRFLELVDEKAEVEQLGTGFTFTEGPLWHPDGYLLFSDMPGDVRRRWTEQEGVTEVANPSNKGNGMTWDLDGRLLVCEHVTSSLVRMDPDGTGSGREVLATHYDGRELNSPNDVVVKSDGTIYFTDPTFGRMPGFGIEREQDLDFQGVYRLPPGASGDGDAPQLVVDDFAQPNGLCFTADERTLYINDTDRAHIRVFDVQEDGSLTGGDVIAENIGTGDLATGELVDGMKLDEHGNIWVTGPKGVWVFSPEGEHLGVVEVPENVGNINWGGPDWSWLFIPASTSMYRVQTKVSGNRLHYMR